MRRLRRQLWRRSQPLATPAPAMGRPPPALRSPPPSRPGPPPLRPPYPRSVVAPAHPAARSPVRPRASKRPRTPLQSLRRRPRMQSPGPWAAGRLRAAGGWAVRTAPVPGRVPTDAPGWSVRGPDGPSGSSSSLGLSQSGCAAHRRRAPLARSGATIRRRLPRDPVLANPPKPTSERGLSRIREQWTAGQAVLRQVNGCTVQSPRVSGASAVGAERFADPTSPFWLQLLNGGLPLEAVSSADRVRAVSIPTG
ncbi:hypothetical protein YWIDRAFT_08294 [Streptomyces sp. SceaMP-e96]|nr:hypothetical protein YWIDRAFT_08294 [Streptomyces sp. SceaMP-e96]